MLNSSASDDIFLKRIAFRVQGLGLVKLLREIPFEAFRSGYNHE